MSLIDKKKKIFGNIAAYKTLTETMPKLKISSSLPSINNENNTIVFLTDLIKSLMGYGVLIKAFVDMMTGSLDKIEVDVKQVLKKGLKSIVSCGVNPMLPAFMKSTGKGLVIGVEMIDFMGIFKVDPTTTSGKLIYNDINSGLQSTDFNTFLFSVIQDDGLTHTWKNMLDIKFNSTDPNGVNPNNSITIKANPSYDNKSLSDLTNNYIDSIKLFNTKDLLNKIIDTIFGSISFKLGKSKKQLESEAKINLVIDRMISNQYENVDDTYFEFDNDELLELEEQANNRSKGIIKIDAGTSFDASIPESFLTSFNDDYSTAVTVQERKKILTDKLNIMADNTTNNSLNPQDKQTIKLNFIQGITDTLIKSIVSGMVSPKVILIFLVTFKIIYGETVAYTSGIDFIKKNKTIFNPLVKRITKEISDFLLVIALKKISELVAQTQALKQVEKAKNKTAQVLSLLGTPQEAIRKLKGLV